VEWRAEERETLESSTLGWVALYAAMLGFAANVLCFVPLVSSAVAIPMTALALACGIVGRRRAAPGSDQRQLCSIALGIAVVDLLLLFIVGLLQLYILSMSFAVALME
jgi:hypothetical protein